MFQLLTIYFLFYCVGQNVWLVNVLFSKIVGKHEKCVFYFYLKPNAHFGQPNIYLLAVLFSLWDLSPLTRD